MSKVSVVFQCTLIVCLKWIASDSHTSAAVRGVAPGAPPWSASVWSMLYISMN